MNVCFSASPSSPSITSCTPNLPNPHLPPTDATRMFDLVYPTIQRNKTSNISGLDESDREWFFSFGRFWVSALLFLDPRLDVVFLTHLPHHPWSPMIPRFPSRQWDSTHPSLLYIVRTSHVIPSPMTTMSVFRLGSCSSLPAISSADTTFSRFLPQYLATSDCIKRRRRFGQPWLERECPSASSRPGRWIEL